MEAVERELACDEKVFILAGVMPVRSVKALMYMKEECPGMSIADEYIKRMQSARTRKEEGVAICVETIKRLRETPGVSGVHIMPVMWESITPRLVEEAGLLPRPEPSPEEEIIEGEAEAQ
jgi:methylenetetrahydrofolate reductase (NADPH)